MPHKTALNKDSRYSFIKSSKKRTRKRQTLTEDANSSNIAAAIRIIKNSIGSIGSIDSPLLFEISEDDGLYQFIDLNGAWFCRYRRIP